MKNDIRLAILAILSDRKWITAERLRFKMPYVFKDFNYEEFLSQMYTEEMVERIEAKKIYFKDRSDKVRKYSDDVFAYRLI